MFRYDDVIDIEKRKDIFINSDQVKGGYRPNIPADPAIIGLDDPSHLKRRNLVSAALHPKAVNVWQDDIRAKAAALIDKAVERRRGAARGRSSSPDLAAPLPAMMIGKLLGFEGDALARAASRGRSETIALGRRAAATSTKTAWSRGDGVRPSGMHRPKVQRPARAPRRRHPDRSTPGPRSTAAL